MTPTTPTVDPTFKRADPAQVVTGQSASTGVVLVGQTGNLRSRLSRTLHAQGWVVDVVDDRAPEDRFRYTPGELRELGSDAPPTLGMASCIALLARPPRNRRRSWWHVWRRRVAERQQENQLIDAVVNTTSNADSCRLLVIVDASEAADVGRMRRRAQQVARVARYESEINGTPVASAFYLVIGADITATQAMPAVLRWATGAPDRESHRRTL